MRIALSVDVTLVAKLCLVGRRVGRIGAAVCAGALLASCGQSPECAAYVACQQAYDDDVDVSDFAADGACWRGALQTAQTCTQRCVAARAAIAQVPDAPAACRDVDAGP